jgi:glycosyltransferase involved in cell wall biosynthesis
MLFSIIIPSFNAALELKNTLDSVLSQRGAELEILVIDGASTDGTTEILRGYGRSIDWQSEKDKGVYEAMNKGIARAKGRFLYFLGVGDTLREGVLERVASQISELPENELALLYGDVLLQDTGEIFGGYFPPSRLRSWNPSHQGIFYARGIFERVGLYELKYPVAADYALNLACWGDAGIVKRYMPFVVANYKGGGLSTSRPDSQFARDFLSLIQKRLGWKPYLLRRIEVLVPAPLKKARLYFIQRKRSRRAA